MIIRIIENNKVVVLNHITQQDEELFMQTNGEHLGFRKINSLPDSPYANYLWDETNQLVIVDEEADAVEVQRNLDKQSREFLNSTDWKVIRELERLYLSDTDLHAERQEVRDSIQDV